MTSFIKAEVVLLQLCQTTIKKIYKKKGDCFKQVSSRTPPPSAIGQKTDRPAPNTRHWSSRRRACRDLMFGSTTKQR